MTARNDQCPMRNSKGRIGPVKKSVLRSADSPVCCFADCQSARAHLGSTRVFLKRIAPAYLRFFAGWQPAIQQAGQPALRRTTAWKLSLALARIRSAER